MPEQFPFNDERPWGNEVWMSKDKPSMVKILNVNPDCKLSLQFHQHRDEFWYVIRGSGTAVRNEERIPLIAGSTVTVKRTEKHRIESGSDGLSILELAYGDFDEKDITRLEDSYGRA